MLHQVFVDSSPKGDLRWIDKATNEIGRHKIGKGKSVHEAEFLAVLRGLADVIQKTG